MACRQTRLLQVVSAPADTPQFITEPLKPPLSDTAAASSFSNQGLASSAFTRNHAAYKAGRNTRVSTVPTISPPMIEIAIEP